MVKESIGSRIQRAEDFKNGLRICKSCGEKKSLNEFRRDKRYETVYQTDCIECESRNYHEFKYTCTFCLYCTMQDEHIPQQSCDIYKRLSKCISKYNEKAWRDKNYKYEYHYDPQQAIIFKNKYNNDPLFRQQEIFRSKASKIRRKGQVEQLPIISQDDISKRYNEYDTCLYCGVSLNDDNKVLDHMDALSNGGKHHIDNLIVCCRPCNTEKRAKSFDIWAMSLDEPYQSSALRIYDHRKFIQYLGGPPQPHHKEGTQGLAFLTDINAGSVRFYSKAV